MTNYTEEINNIRKTREESFAANPLSWLNLAGLFWLEEGRNTFGSSPEAKISMPEFPQPISGYFQFEGGRVHLYAQTTMSMNGGELEQRPLFTDQDERADLIEVGRLTMKIIIRGDATLVRIYDREAELKSGFKGFSYYPPKPEYKVTANYIRYDPPKPTIRVEGIGTEVNSFFMGRAIFTLNGIECSLEAEKSDDELLFNFRDQTNAKTTYGGGRRFYLPPPAGDEIVLDFNLTDNWPCAYTPYATCPIPPKENALKIAVEAGEKKFK